MAEFSFEICDVECKQNILADYLSRSVGEEVIEKNEEEKHVIMTQNLQAIRGSPDVVYTPSDVIRRYSSSTMTAYFIFCLYTIGLLE